MQKIRGNKQRKELPAHTFILLYIIYTYMYYKYILYLYCNGICWFSQQSVNGKCFWISSMSVLESAFEKMSESINGLCVHKNVKICMYVRQLVYKKSALDLFWNIWEGPTFELIRMASDTTVLRFMKVVCTI